MTTQERAHAGAPDTGRAGDSLDPVDVLRGLAHMDVLRQRVRVARAHRLGSIRRLATTAAAAHILDYGHELSFGCCRPPHEYDAHRREAPSREAA